MPVMTSTICEVIYGNNSDVFDRDNLRVTVFKLRDSIAKETLIKFSLLHRSIGYSRASMKQQRTLAMANGFERYTKKTRRALFFGADGAGGAVAKAVRAD